jgi:hypothetical protein
MHPPEAGAQFRHRPMAAQAQRTYLFVPPEEKLEAQALGAHWDDVTKRWYIQAD